MKMQEFCIMQASQEPVIRIDWLKHTISANWTFRLDRKWNRNLQNKPQSFVYIFIRLAVKRLQIVIFSLHNHEIVSMRATKITFLESTKAHLSNGKNRFPVLCVSYFQNPAVLRWSFSRFPIERKGLKLHAIKLL